MLGVDLLGLGMSGIQYAGEWAYDLEVVDSTLRYTRTEAERADQRLSWFRPDRAFFAAGACHILAFVVAEELAEPAGEVVAMVPRSSGPGSHVYYRLGTHVFDFNGWNAESEVLARTRLDYTAKYPGWDYDLVVVGLSLELFCKQFDSRPPRDYFSSPIPRARAYAHTMGVLELVPEVMSGRPRAR